MKFSEKLTMYQAKKGMTLKQLAAYLGFSETSLSLWATGRREPGRANKKRIEMQMEKEGIS